MENINGDSVDGAKIVCGELGFSQPVRTLGEGIFSYEELGIKEYGLDRKAQLFGDIVSTILDSEAFNDRIEQRSDDGGILLVNYTEDLLRELKDVMHMYHDVIITTEDLSKGVIKAIANSGTDLVISKNVKVNTDEGRSVLVDPRLLSLKDASTGKLALSYDIVETKPEKPLSMSEIIDKFASIDSVIKQLMSEIHGNETTEPEPETSTVVSPEADGNATPDSDSTTETETSTVVSPESVTLTATAAGTGTSTEISPESTTLTATTTETETETSAQPDGDATPDSGVAGESTSEADPSSETGGEDSTTTPDNQE